MRKTHYRYPRGKQAEKSTDVRAERTMQLTLWHFLPVLVALNLVEFTALSKLEQWLSWGNPRPLSITTALAFLSLLLCSIVALSIAMRLQLSQQISKRLTIGGYALFLTQGLANILISFQYAQEHLPVAVLVAFFNLRADIALKLTALLQGGILSLVSIAFWQILAHMLEYHFQQREAAEQQFADLERLFAEEVQRRDDV